MQAKGEPLRGWRMRRLLFGVIHVLCVCGTVSVPNRADADGGCERFMSH